MSPALVRLLESAFDTTAPTVNSPYGRCWLQNAVNLEESRSIPVIAVGATAASREEWEAERARDAERLNKFFKAENLVEGYEVSLAQGSSAEDLRRQLDELRGFSEVEVIVQITQIELLEGLEERDYIAALPVADPLLLSQLVVECLALETAFVFRGAGSNALTSGSTGFLNLLAGTAIAFAENLNARELARVFTAADGWMFGESDISFERYQVHIPELIESRFLALATDGVSAEEIPAKLKEAGLNL
jgi:hypothetical protein